MNLPNYDTWIEAPFIERVEAEDRYERWLDENELDLMEEFLEDNPRLSEDSRCWDKFDKKEWEGFLHSKYLSYKAWN